MRQPPETSNALSYQRALITTHGDRVSGSSGRRDGAGDVGHRQAVPTRSAGPHARPEGRRGKAFGQRRARLTIHRIALPRAPCGKPCQAVSRGHYQRSLVSVVPPYVEPLHRGFKIFDKCRVGPVHRCRACDEDIVATALGMERDNALRQRTQAPPCAISPNGVADAAACRQTDPRFAVAAGLGDGLENEPRRGTTLT